MTPWDKGAARACAGRNLPDHESLQRDWGLDEFERSLFQHGYVEERCGLPLLFRETVKRLLEEARVAKLSDAARAEIMFFFDVTCRQAFMAGCRHYLAGLPLNQSVRDSLRLEGDIQGAFEGGWQLTEIVSGAINEGKELAGARVNITGLLLLRARRLRDSS